MYRLRERQLAVRAGELDDEADDLDARNAGYHRMVRDVLETQRRAILALRDRGVVSDEVLHVIERELDLEEELLEEA